MGIARGIARTDESLVRDSWYVASSPFGPPHAALQGEHQADVAVVGGGLAGVSAALELATRGYSVALLEAHQCGWGASGRNGGQALAGLACDMDVIAGQLGEAAACRVWDMTLEAIALIHERRERHAIACDWRPGYLAMATTPRKARALYAACDDLRTRFGFDAVETIAAADVRRWIDSPRYAGGAFDPVSGHLHPLKYVQGLARAAAAAGVRLFERSPVLRIEPDAVTVSAGSTGRGAAGVVVHTAAGHVRARQVLLAGNVHIGDLMPSLGRRIMPVGTYIVTSAPLDPERAAALIPTGACVCDTNFVLDYFRLTADHRVLFGGRVSYSTVTPRNLAPSMRQRMLAVFPQLADVPVDHAWGGFVDITMNRAPDFGRIGDQIWYLQGFSGHGLALTGLAGKLVAEAMAGQSERFDVFARLRHAPFPGGALLRTPALVLGMLWYRMRDWLG